MANENIVAGFRSVDQAAQPDTFVHSLEAVSAMAPIQAVKHRTLPEAENWQAQLKRADEAGCFFAAVTFFLASGRKP